MVCGTDPHKGGICRKDVPVQIQWPDWDEQMKKKPGPMEFLAKAQEDAKLSARISAAVERGGRVTAEEVLQIAKEFGFSFTSAQFESAVKRDYAARFAAGDTSLADMMAKPRPKPPESSCARGCLSYTKSWHPSNFQLED
jgi:hypothetical protein